MRNDNWISIHYKTNNKSLAFITIVPTYIWSPKWLGLVHKQIQVSSFYDLCKSAFEWHLLKL
jgi:hypothetical protein